MPQYDLESASCGQCNKTYSNKYSLGTHKSRYHPKHSPMSETAVEDDQSDGNEDESDDHKDESDGSHKSDGEENEAKAHTDDSGSDHDDVTSIIDELGSHSEHSIDTEDEVDKTRDSDNDSKSSRFDRSSGKSRRKQFARRHQPYRLVNEKLDKILKEVEELGNKQKPINIDEAINHSQLIKMFCKAALDGSMSLQKTHIDALKPHRDAIRRIAHGRSDTRAKLIQLEVDRYNQTGESILKTILARMMTIFKM